MADATGEAADAKVVDGIQAPNRLISPLELSPDRIPAEVSFPKTGEE
jgi:hypothetical protein